MSIYWIEAKRKSHTWLEETKAPFFFTSGCFDLLHPGHIHFLYKANRLAAVAGGLPLLVAVNSDTSVQAWKGHEPVMPEEDRLFMIAALSAVNYVTLFDEQTPRGLIRQIQPQAVIHGHSEDRPAWGSVSAAELIGYGGQVIRIPLVGDWSSTRLKEGVLRSFQSDATHK